MEQTILNGINALVDTTKIKVVLFNIDNETNNINIELFLKGGECKINCVNPPISDTKVYNVPICQDHLNQFSYFH